MYPPPPIYEQFVNSPLSLILGCISKRANLLNIKRIIQHRHKPIKSIKRKQEYVKYKRAHLILLYECVCVVYLSRLIHT